MKIRRVEGNARPIDFVSAFYPGPNKYGDASYLRWIRELFVATRGAWLHFYVPTKALEHRMRGLGASETVVFHVLSEEDLPARNLAVPWEDQVLLDPERLTHQESPHLYVVWNSKVGLSARIAAASDPETQVFWIDAGYVRDARTREAIRRFPSRRQIRSGAQGGLHFLLVKSFTGAERRHAQEAVPDDFRGLVRLGAGMFGGRQHAWGAFDQHFSRAIEAWAESGQFVGKDQYVFAAILLRRPELATAWRVSRVWGDPWFSFPQSFGGGSPVKVSG